jgi:hypothetical protein
MDLTNSCLLQGTCSRQVVNPYNITLTGSLQFSPTALAEKLFCFINAGRAPKLGGLRIPESDSTVGVDEQHIVSSNTDSPQRGRGAGNKMKAAINEPLPENVV